MGNLAISEEQEKAENKCPVYLEKKCVNIEENELYLMQLTNYINKRLDDNCKDISLL